jgi:hypothetical protein
MKFESALTERQNKSISGFDLAYTQPFEAQAQANFALIPATDLVRTTYGLNNITTKGGPAVCRQGYGQWSLQYSEERHPRANRLCLRVNSKTVIRGGFGCIRDSSVSDAATRIQPGYTQRQCSL